jgi:hypothetical protein
MFAHKLVPCHPSHWTLAQMAKNPIFPQLDNFLPAQENPPT